MTTGYTSWNAATSRPFVHPVEETKTKPVVASTDIQGISGKFIFMTCLKMVTSKQTWVH